MITELTIIMNFFMQYVQMIFVLNLPVQANMTGEQHYLNVILENIATWDWRPMYYHTIAKIMMMFIAQELSTIFGCKDTKTIFLGVL